MATSIVYILKVLQLVCVIQCLQWSGAQPQTAGVQPQTSGSQPRSFLLQFGRGRNRRQPVRNQTASAAAPRRLEQGGYWTGTTRTATLLPPGTLTLVLVLLSGLVLLSCFLLFWHWCVGQHERTNSTTDVLRENASSRLKHRQNAEGEKDDEEEDKEEEEAEMLPQINQQTGNLSGTGIPAVIARTATLAPGTLVLSFMLISALLLLVWIGLPLWALIFCIAIGVYALRKKAPFRLKYNQKEIGGDEDEGNAELVPRMAVFECIGIIEKFDAHRIVLASQLLSLAQFHNVIIKRDSMKQTEEQWVSHLKTVLQSELDKVARGKECARALEIFVIGKEGSPSDSIQSMRKLYLLAVMVIAVQTFGLGFMIYFSIGELQKCQPSLWNFTAVLLVNMLILNYYSQARTIANGTYQVTADVFWTLLANLAFLISTITALAAANIVIWTQNEVSAIVAYSTMILCVCYLGEIVMTLFVISPEQFGRWAISNCKLLQECPKTLEDLIDDDANDTSKIWKIVPDEDGKLLKFDSKPAKPCESILRHDHPSEPAILERFMELFGQLLHVALVLPVAGVISLALLAQNS